MRGKSKMEKSLCGDELVSESFFHRHIYYPLYIVILLTINYNRELFMVMIIFVMGHGQQPTINEL